MLRMGVDQYHHVVRKTRVLNMGIWLPSGGLNRLFQHLIYLIEIEVTEQRRNHPCGSPKLCPCTFSTAWIIAIHRPTAIRAAHVLHHRGPNWNNAPGLPYSSEPSARKPLSSAATHCAQAQASQATDCCAR